MQRLSDELEDLLRALANIRNVFGNGLPRRPVPRLCGDRLLDDFLLLFLDIKQRYFRQ